MKNGRLLWCSPNSNNERIKSIIFQHSGLLSYRIYTSRTENLSNLLLLWRSWETGKWSSVFSQRFLTLSCLVTVMFMHLLWMSIWTKIMWFPRPFTPSSDFFMFPKIKSISRAIILIVRGTISTSDERKVSSLTVKIFSTDQETGIY